MSRLILQINHVIGGLLKIKKSKMERVLIAISSCERDSNNGFNDAVRKTWLNNAKVDYKFFKGIGGTESHDDEVILDCKDDYLSLPEKTLEILKWALDNNYDYVFKCDTDTYVVLDRLLSSDFRNWDYIGHFNAPIGIPNVVYRTLYTWASGGSGYFLSKKAAEIIVKLNSTEKAMCPNLRIPCEDLWIGQVLGPDIEKGNLKATSDNRYGWGFNDDFSTEFTSHYCSEGKRRKFDADWMYAHHTKNS